MTDLAMLVIGIVMGIMINETVRFIFKKKGDVDLKIDESKFEPGTEKRHNENKM